MAGGRSGRGATATVLAAACLALAAALLLPGAAAAKRGLIFPEGGSGPEFSLGKRGGVKLNVSTKGQQVTFAVEDGAQSVDYEVRGRVAHGGIRADLGSAGRVNVEFEPAGPPKPVEALPFCKGRHETVIEGVFAGTLVFTGLNHFARFHATRIPGTVTRPGNLHCHFPGGRHPQSPEKEGAEEGEEDVDLTASVEKRVVFVAITERQLVARPFTLYAAISKERVGRVRIGRLLLLPIPGSGSFSFDEGLTSATVAPPAPFRGSAKFERGATGSPPSWTGNLRVAFLDRTIALTGQGFKASLGNPREIGGSASRLP